MPPQKTDDNSWAAWSHYVLEELKRIDKKLSCIEERIRNVEVEIATLKVKSGTWGAIGALIPIVLATIAWVLMK